MKKIASADEFWAAVDRLGDQQSFYLLEQYVPGDIFHVDTITYEKELLFSMASKYGRPPMDVSHEGDIFTTRTLAEGWMRKWRCALSIKNTASLWHGTRSVAQRIHQGT